MFEYKCRMILTPQKEFAAVRLAASNSPTDTFYIGKSHPAIGINYFLISQCRCKDRKKFCRRCFYYKFVQERLHFIYKNFCSVQLRLSKGWYFVCEDLHGILHREQRYVHVCVQSKRFG